MHNLSLEQYSELLKTLYDGALEPSPWQSFLRLAEERLNLTACYLFLRYPDANDRGLMFTSRPQQAMTPDNPANIYCDNLFVNDPLVITRINELVMLDDLVDQQSLCQSEFYQLCMAPFDVHHTAGIDLEYENHERFAVRFSRSQAQGPFTANDRKLLTLLSAHIHRAVVLGDKLVRFDNERQLWANSPSSSHIGVVMLNERGRIIKANALADQFMRENDGLTQQQDLLRLHDPLLDKQLTALVQTKLHTQKNAELTLVNALAVPRLSGKAAYELVVKAVPVDPMIASKGSPHISVFIYNPERRGEISIELLMKLYRLTEMEARVAIMLAKGQTLEAIASELTMAKNTVRAHLRAIFAKTGVTQQSMLVHLVLRSLAAM